MPTHTDQWAAFEFLYGILSMDSALGNLVNGIYRRFSPQSTETPYVVMNMVTGTPMSKNNAIRIFTEALIDVVVVAKEEQRDIADQAVALIDGLIHRASGTSSNGRVWSCVNDRALPDNEEAYHGIVFIYPGATYRLQATAT
jgi:Protein of unknown function (DUF3168)